MYPDTIIGVLLISAVAIADVKVTQSPGNIEITEGQEFQISCTFTTSSNVTQYGITWYKAVAGCENCNVMNTSEEFIGRVLDKHDDVSKSKQLIVMDAKQNDSGIYYCEVVVMRAGNGRGKGTRVTVNGTWLFC
ncbi:immunoglobulin superfamily member 11-like [Scyliorhinus canicula]|uniref:immunoglobulin superfamily member 11-like n=1 Tax=Scyliorhinus canicula TaxID=7830 RepID=UPI0018F52F74|nr:immunoglobulin superfamily member 11-like [Scyliorhinus canicula]